MIPVQVIGLQHNRMVTPAEIAACRALVAALGRAAGGTAGSFGAESAWIGDAGRQVYGGVTPDTLASFSDAFVRFLRLSCRIFTGYDLRNVLTDAKTPSWTDTIRFVGAEDLPDWSIAAYLEMEQRLPPDLLCIPPLVAGEVGYAVDGRCVNRDAMCYQAHVERLHLGGVIDRLRGLAHPRILEIGGGYGGLAYFLTRFVPRARYTIVDLPSSLMHAGCYLTVAQQTHPVAVLEAGTDPARDGVTLVLNDQAERLGDTRFDLAINTWSFSEMAPAVVRAYGALIARTLAPDGQFYEQNYRLEAPDSNFSRPDRILAEIFPHCRTIEGGLLFEAPRLWSLG